MFKVAIVGHSQVPEELVFDREDVSVDIFRAPGGRASTFFLDRRMADVGHQKYDLVILWLGSNDITPHCVVRKIADKLAFIVKDLERKCEAQVRMCLIEPRYPDGRLDQTTYEKVAKGINNLLQRRLLKKYRFISFGAKPFWDSLDTDGVHFDPIGCDHVANKFRNCILNVKWEKEQSQIIGRPILGATFVEG